MKDQRSSLILLVVAILFVAGFSDAAYAQLPVQQQPPALAPDTGALPESYYNSLKNQSSQTSTIVSNQHQTSVSSPQVQTVTAETTNSTTQENRNEAPNATEVPVETPTTSVDASLFNATYVLTQIGAIRQELNQIREEYSAKSQGKNVGYDGSFFIKSDDDNFRLNFNFRSQVRYSFNLAEDIENGHTLNLRRQFIMITGNAYNQKVTYALILATTNSPAQVALDIGYQFNPAFAIHATEDNILFTPEAKESSAKLTFVNASIMAERYNLGPSFGLYATGSYKWLSYYAGVFNSLNTDLAPNTNTEMAYSLRLDFKVLNALSPGMSDLDYSDKPAIAYGIGGVFGHYEDGTQARMMAVTSDLRFKYKGLSMSVAGVYRQTDPDQFTIAQTDLAATAYASYFVIPKKLELGIRYSHLFDDINDAGVNISMGGGNRTRLGGALSGGDVGGDSDNEWETTFGINYYLYKYNVKLQGEYLMIVDGIPGPDDRVNHIGVAQVQLQF